MPKIDKADGKFGDAYIMMALGWRFRLAAGNAVLLNR